MILDHLNGPTFSHKCPYEREAEEIWHTNKKRQCKDRARRLATAKKCQQPLEARWGKEEILSRASRAFISTPWCWFQTSDFQNCERINSWCFKAPNLWQYKIAATGNEYSYYSSFFFFNRWANWIEVHVEPVLLVDFLVTWDIKYSL